MKIQLIRNATLKLEYNGKTILVDPMLGDKGAYDPFVGGPRNPTVELPIPAGEVVKGTDLVLITHTHPDHIDPPAVAALDKKLKQIVQEAVDFAEESPLPDPSEIYEDVYSEPNYPFITE